jgi:hypothetical protein
MTQIDETKPVEAPAPLFCYNHPTVETGLRCSRCGRPICTRCARLTPTGYRCPECMKTQQRVFETAEWYDYPIAAVIAGAIALLGSLIVPRLGFFTILVAPFVGFIIAEAVRAAVRKRRGKRLFQIAAAAAALGCAALPLLGLVVGGVGGRALFGLLWYGVYAFLVTSSVYTRLACITMR